MVVMLNNGSINTSRQMARSCVIGSSPITSAASGTDENVLSISDGRE